MKRVPGREDAEVYSHQRQIDDYAVERTRLFPTPFGSFTPLDLPGGGSPLFVSAHCQHGNPWNRDTIVWFRPALAGVGSSFSYFIFSWTGLLDVVIGFEHSIATLGEGQKRHCSR